MLIILHVGVMSILNGCSLIIFSPACSEKIATECLKKASWAVEPAINLFFSSGLAASGSNVNFQQIESMYSKYKEKDGDMILADGVVSFVEDLGVDPSDVVMVRDDSAVGL